MNVALQPAMRCHYDAGENILRVVLMEQVAFDGKEAKDEVAIYALKVCHKVCKSWSVRLISRRAAGAFIEGRLQGLSEALCTNDRFKVAS